MRKWAPAAALVLVMLSSCVSAVYVREWELDGRSVSDRLTITGDHFRLERAGQGGVSEFEGAFTDDGEEWVLEVTAWKPPGRTVRWLDPPARFVYRVKVFQNGVSFLSVLDVQGSPTFSFIPRGDFENR